MTVPRKDYIETKKDSWATPAWLFQLLDNEFHFGLDAAAQLNNAKCEHYLHLNSLECNWKFQSRGKPVFLNPPYSGKQIDKFMEKARREAADGLIIVCLIPVASDVKWWHKNVMEAQEIRFIEGRVDYVGFDNEGNQILQSPTFPSCVVIFDESREPTLQNSNTVCGLDEPCEEGYTKYEGQKCSCGYRDCYDENYPPVIGKTIKKPRKKS